MPAYKTRDARGTAHEHADACLESLCRARRVGLLRLLGVVTQAEEVVEAGTTGGEPLSMSGSISGLDDRTRCR